MSNKKRNGYSTSWTQPYPTYTYNVTYTSQELADGLIKKYNLNSIDDVVNWLDSELEKMDVEQELDRLDEADALVDAMDSYPDAERIISKAMGRED